MKKSIYYLLSIILCLHITYSFPQIAYAKENTTDITQNTSIITLNPNHKQTSIIYDQSNNMYILTIEPLDIKNKIANGTYKISYTAPRKWTAYFYAKISDNKFSSCYSPHVTALTGKIRDYSLKKSSNTSSILRIKYEYLFSTTITGIKSVISNGKIKTTIL